MTNEWIGRPQGTRGLPAGLASDTRVLYRLLLDDEIHNDVAGNLNWRDGPGCIAEYRVIVVPKAPAPAVPPDWLASDSLLAPVGVGDVAGTTMGSAARFNAGKPDLSLIPAGIIAELQRWSVPLRDAPRPAFRVDWGSVLATLDDFQMRRDVDFRNTLYRALHLMDNDGKLWAEIARVFAYGKEKYSAWNWARGQAWSIPIASWMRHIVFGTLQGEEIDPESGLSHRGHIGCNVVMLLWFLENYPEGDDRYTPPLPHV